MLDFDKINKYNRILSAKSGTQVPKFLTPASTLELSTGIDKGFEKWLLSNGLQLHEGNFEELWGYYQNSIKDLSPQPLTGSSKGLMFLSNTNNISLPTTTLGGTSKQLIMTPSVTTPVKPLEDIFFKNFEPESLINLTQLNGPVALLDIDAKAKGLPAPPATMDPDPKIAAADARYAEAIKNDPTMLAKMNLQISEGILKADEEVAALKKAKLEASAKTAGEISQAVLQMGNGIASSLHDGSNERAEGLKITNMTNTAINTAGAELSKINPLAGGIVQNANMTGNIISEIGGTQTDKMTTVDSIMDSGLMQATGLGFINGALGESSDSFAADKTLLEQIGGSYGGSSSTIFDALNKAGKKYGWFSNRARRKANEQIAEAKRQQDVMGVINLNTQDRLDMASSNHDLNHLSYRMTLSGGYDLRYNRAAKEGMKFDEWEPTIEGIWEPEIELFKKGGKTSERKIDVIETDTNQKSVIPEGALHKNKHHLKDTGLDDSELTKKGIPVVDNHGEQQAEIELNEIIFTLEVTKEIEKRYKEFYLEDTSNKRKDELALEAGKLLWKEILYNTDDRTGLIDTLKKGGTIDVFKKGGNSKHQNNLESNPREISIEEYLKRRNATKEKIQQYLQQTKIAGTNKHIMKDHGKYYYYESYLRNTNDPHSVDSHITEITDPNLIAQLDATAQLKQVSGVEDLYIVLNPNRGQSYITNQETGEKIQTGGNPLIVSHSVIPPIQPAQPIQTVLNVLLGVLAPIDNTILINKTNRTLTVGGKTFKISISKKGTAQTTKSGDNLTPEGIFGLGNRRSMGGYKDSVYGYRPNAYGGRFYTLTGGIAEGRGFGIHGSDEYNDPDRYEIGKFGTHGCIAMKNSDLEQLEEILNQGGGPLNFKVKIIKSAEGGVLTKQGGILNSIITQEDINLMVKQALLNLLK